MRRILSAFICLFAVTFTFAAHAQAVNNTILHSFNATTTDVSQPQNALLLDSKGNLYGTAYDSGAFSKGGVFELSPNGDGSYTEQVLYSFGAVANDAALPTSNLTFDSAGNLYGTTSSGAGSNRGCVFELSPPKTKGQPWSETILHSFVADGTDGYYPAAGVIFDAKGNLLGATPAGGTDEVGVVFELAPQSGGSWKETIVHSFGNDANNDGGEAYSGLIADAAGNFYGTTATGGIGTAQLGTVYELTANSDGSYTESILYAFGTNGPSDSQDLMGDLVFDTGGNLYGTSVAGGASQAGTIYELSPPKAKGGAWTEQILHSFASTADGSHPQGAVTLVNGNIYATTTAGGTLASGAIVELTPKLAGGWNESVVHSFGGANDAGIPLAGMIADSKGILYGATTAGGSHSDGEVFSIPASEPATFTALTASPTSISAGENITLKATVTGAGATPSGSVTFSAEGVALATINLNGSGVAALTANSNGYPAATYPIAATYSGSSSYAKSTSPMVNISLTKAPTATTLTASPTSVTPPGSVTLTATVKRSASGAEGTPTGSVTFSTSGVTLATIKVNSSGVAALTAPSSGYPAGQYPIKASYAGDASDATSTSSAVTVTVK